MSEASVRFPAHSQNIFTMLTIKEKNAAPMPLIVLYHRILTAKIWIVQISNDKLIRMNILFVRLATFWINETSQRQLGLAGTEAGANREEAEIISAMMSCLPLWCASKRAVGANWRRYRWDERRVVKMWFISFRFHPGACNCLTQQFHLTFTPHVNNRYCRQRQHRNINSTWQHSLNSFNKSRFTNLQILFNHIDK